jgi:hypothetical protein
MTLRFSDGMQFDTSGPLRVIRRSDGYYVTGKGLLIPCDSREEGNEIIADLKKGGNQ